MKKISIIIFFSIFLILTMIINHEVTHYQIASYYNCENITYGVDWNSIYVSAAPGTCDDVENLMMMHSINEIVGYNIMPFLVLITAFVFGKFLPD